MSPGEFQATLLQLSELGTPVSQELSTEDVTGRVVDLESRIRTAEASIGRLRGYLEGAGSVGDLAQLEGELLVRETDLETLVGQQRALEGQVDFATVVVTFALDGEAETPDESDDELPGFLEGLRGGTQVALAAGTVALAAVGAIIPFLPVVAVVALGVGLGRRRKHRTPALADGPSLDG